MGVNALDDPLPGSTIMGRIEVRQAIPDPSKVVSNVRGDPTRSQHNSGAPVVVGSERHAARLESLDLTRYAGGGDEGDSLAAMQDTVSAQLQDMRADVMLEAAAAPISRPKLVPVKIPIPSAGPAPSAPPAPVAVEPMAHPGEPPMTVEEAPAPAAGEPDGVTEEDVARFMDTLVGTDEAIGKVVAGRTNAPQKDTNPKDAVGIKKVPLSSVVPAPVIGEIALGLLEGARKYGRHNYRIAGVRMSVYLDATQRHLDSFKEGQDIDPYSGLNHITKALSSLTVLRDAMMNDMAFDDRPPRMKNQNWVDDQNAKAAEIINRYPDSKPPYVIGDEKYEVKF